jgi:hypothetical protein
MWVFTKYGFYSIACANDSDGNLDVNTVMVRARDDQHLRNLQERFPDTEIGTAEIIALPSRDYGFRIIVPKSAWVQALSQLATEQTWSNFKNEVGTYSRIKNLSRDYVDALHDIWGVMYRIQTRLKRKTKALTPPIQNS